MSVHYILLLYFVIMGIVIMEIEKIEQIANDHGIDMYYHRPVLTDTGDGKVKCLRKKELTYFGKKIIEFANAIESEVLWKK